MTAQACKRSAACDEEQGGRPAELADLLAMDRQMPPPGDTPVDQPFYVIRPGTTWDQATWGAILVNLVWQGGNREKAAKALGCSVNRIYKSLQRHGLSTTADLSALQQAAALCGVAGIQSPPPEIGGAGGGFGEDVVEGNNQVQMLRELKRLAQRSDVLTQGLMKLLRCAASEERGGDRHGE